MEELLKNLREKTITPEEALNQSVFTATHIKDISLDDMKLEVIESGWQSVDDYKVFKKARGELIVVGALPGMGKTAFMSQLATHVARTGNVLVFSLEMNKEAIKHRLIAMQAKRHIIQVQSGEIDEEEVASANAELSKLNLYIEDNGAVTANDIYSTALAYHKRHGLAMVVVDYLQIIKTQKGRSRNEELAEDIQKLKQLARIINGPVVVASQLNRSVVSRGKDPKYNGTEEERFLPGMNDLRDSGAIEAEADVVLMLSRHEALAPKNCPPHLKDTAQVSIAKHRNGQVGLITLSWLGSRTMFKDQFGKEKHHGKESSKQKTSEEIDKQNEQVVEGIVKRQRLQREMSQPSVVRLPDMEVDDL